MEIIHNRRGIVLCRNSGKDFFNRFAEKTDTPGERDSEMGRQVNVPLCFIIPSHPLATDQCLAILLAMTLTVVQVDGAAVRIETAHSQGAVQVDAGEIRLQQILQVCAKGVYLCLHYHGTGCPIILAHNDTVSLRARYKYLSFTIGLRQAPSKTAPHP